MADNVQKTPFVKSVNQFVDTKTDTAVELQPKSAPCTVTSVDPTGTIVTVNIDVQGAFPYAPITCPVATTEYARAPIQKGTQGVVVSCDLYLGGVSGLGGGVATETPQPNLSTCFFIPLGNTDLTPTDDPQSYVVYGPNGVILRDGDSHCIFKLTPNGIQITLNGVPYMTFSSSGVALTFAGNEIAITSGGININGQNLTVIDGHNFILHSHTGVQTGSSDTGAVTP